MVLSAIVLAWLAILLRTDVSLGCQTPEPMDSHVQMHMQVCAHAGVQQRSHSCPSPG